MNDALPFCPWYLVSYVVRSVKLRVYSTVSLLEQVLLGCNTPPVSISFPGPSCLADLDPHAGHGWEHLVLLFLCLGFRSLVCDL